MKKIKLLDGNYIYVYNNGLYKKDCISRIIINSKDYGINLEDNFIIIFNYLIIKYYILKII